MRFQATAIIFLLFTTLAQAQGRKPAVEDFMGVEIEEVAFAPAGTEALFNFEKEVQNLVQEEGQPSPRQQQPGQQFAEAPAQAWSTSTMMGIIVLLGLPFLTWLLIMNHLRQKATQETASNIEILEKYRKERELVRKAQAEQAQDKKAS
jgi:hypothetical protein